MHELHELILGQGSRRPRQSWTVQVQVEQLEERVVPAAPIEAVNYVNAMLNKLVVGIFSEPALGPYPEEGFRTGGRSDLEDYTRDVINSMGSTSDVYVPKLTEFAPQFYFNDTAPNRARDNWVRDFAHLKVMAGATSSPEVAIQPSLMHAVVGGDALALSAGGKKSEPDATWYSRLGGYGNEGRSALMAAGDPNGTPPDSPDNHIDPNTADSPFAGVGVVSLARGNNIAGGGTGVAIGPRHVLTAAHVVDLNLNGHRDGADWDSIEFWLNLDTDSPVDQPDVIIPAVAWYIHPDAFNPGNAFFHDDIAVIELSTPLPAGVPFYDLYSGDLAGQTFHMVGYGRSGDGLNGFTIQGSRTIKRVGQNVADYFEGQDDHRRPEAMELWRADFDHPTDPSLNFLGGPSLGNDKESIAGPGDSGGPAFVRVGNNPGKASSYQIGGVITHGIPGLSLFGLFGSGFGGTVVSAYQDWIQTILVGNVPALENAGASSGGGGNLTAFTADLGLPSDLSADLHSSHFAFATVIHTLAPDIDVPRWVYDQAVTMSFRNGNGTTTTSDGGYVARTGTLTFAPGETTKTITIAVKGDSRREGNETFYLDLFDNSSNSLFTKNRGIGTILNDD
jgi:hypothetical protein